MREYTTIDKTSWGPGPWQDEPDKRQWVDEATGLDCLIVRSKMSGSWCGYVGVPREHPLYGADYDDAHDQADLEVHGGLTFASTCSDGPEDTAICHVPEPGRSDDVWWLGFDCAHAFDISPATDAHFREMGLPKLATALSSPLRDVYRTVDYVTGEVTALAEQLHAVSASVAADVEV